MTDANDTTPLGTKNTGKISLHAFSSYFIFRKFILKVLNQGKVFSYFPQIITSHIAHILALRFTATALASL